MSKLTACVVCPDLAVNCLGRAHVLAELLAPEFDVRIVGPATGPVWLPLRNSPFQMDATPAVGSGCDIWSQVRRNMDSDLIYVSKPIWTSMSAALETARRRHSGLLLDIDDPELGILAETLRSMPMVARLRFIGRHRRWHHREPWNVVMGAARVKAFRYRTVSNAALQRRHGGVLVPHVRDAQLLNPADYDRTAIRQRLLAAPAAPTIAFVGTPRPTKGLETLVEAVAQQPGRDVHLALVGMDDSQYSLHLAESARRRLGKRVQLAPQIDVKHVADWLIAADIVAVPQGANAVSYAQMPAKVFDAMALARPIVATRMCDLPDVLDNCAELVAPDDVAALTRGIGSLLANPTAAQQMGVRARQRLLERYSHDVIRPSLIRLARQAIAAIPA